MKQNLFRITGIGIILVLFAGSIYLGWTKPVRTPMVTPAASTNTQETKKTSVTLILDTGDRVTTYSGILARTPYEALSDVVKREQMPLETKQYDFGVFVKKIGTYESDNTKAWIVSVNGHSLTSAADKTQIENGDIVEWVYSPVK